MIITKQMVRDYLAHRSDSYIEFKELLNTFPAKLQILSYLNQLTEEGQVEFYSRSDKFKYIGKAIE